MIRQQRPPPPVASTTAARRECDELAARAAVAERAADALAVLEQPRDRALHEHVDARVHGLVLERADQLEAGAVADVHQPPVRVAAERALRHPPVRRAVEDRAPVLELAHAVRRLLGVQLGHVPVVQVLAAEHRVLEVGLPAVRRHRRCRAPRRRRPRPSPCGPCRAATCRPAPSARRARRPRSRRAGRRRQRRSPGRRTRGARGHRRRHIRRSSGRGTRRPRRARCRGR